MDQWTPPCGGRRPCQPPRRRQGLFDPGPLLPQIALSGESATTVTERSWEYLWLTPGCSLLLCLFVSSILRFSEDVWFLHACKIGVSSAAVPFDGRPQGGGHLESTARVRAEGALDLSIRWALVPSLEPITLRSNRPSAAAVRLDRPWTLMFRCHDNARALSARYNMLAGPNHKFGRRSAASALCRARSRASL